MSASGSGARGWPLLSLGIVLTSWIMLRVVLWETPFVIPTPEALPRVGGETMTLGRPSPHAFPVPLRKQGAGPETLPGASASAGLAPASLARPLFRRRVMDRAIAQASLLIAEREAEVLQNAQTAPRQEQPEPVVGPVAPGVAFAPDTTRTYPKGALLSRWSLDAWALWRDDTTTALTSGRPSYGRSQAGAVLRYRLDFSSERAPQLHLRATRALAGASETDVALGASARPVPAIPVRLAAEGRVSETDRGSELRGAVYAVTELPPVALPAGLTAEAYLQAGYVTGDFATPFADGQARVTRELAGNDNMRLSAGGAAWGGAQEDAQRLDIGPSAGLAFRIGETRARISADYRFRIAGDAEPSSGPALTLTAGF